ncbi:diacylglycerol/lipid kinase family protein [Chloroflexota bacterium]
MSIQYARAIVNPAAGGHSTYREWSLMSKHLINNGLLLDYVYTEGTGHATELAMEAANSDYRYIIAVGGDGTINEVVNGILNSAASNNTTLGVVSAGTTCSFARSLGIPLDLVSSCNLLASQNRLLIDVGIVEYTSKGQKLSRFFINEADVGFGATVVETAIQSPSRFGRKFSYLPRVIGGFASLAGYENKCITVLVDDENEEVFECAMIVMANGAYFGGGMQMAPDAKPNDGLLDMVIFGNMSKSELLKTWPLTYKGRHVDHDKVRLLKIRNVTIQCAEKILVEADGELLGEGPVSFSVVPSALTVTCPPQNVTKK